MTTNTLKSCMAILALLAVNYSAQAQSPARLIDNANMDLTVKPGDDFYQYASGTWIKNNPVPAKETRWGSFNVLRDFNINAVKGLIENAAADPLRQPDLSKSVLVTSMQPQWTAQKSKSLATPRSKPTFKRSNN